MPVERIRSFSIREYAAKSRAVDLERCWPLGRVGEKEERRLPLLTWRKFRWWSSELDTARSADLARKDEEVVGEEGADGLGKVTRPPKKRSIVEIFAVAPQIDGGGKDEGEDVEDGDFDRCNLELVKSRKEESVEIRMKKKSAEMKKKKKKKKKKNWGKIYDLKMISSKLKNKKQKPTTTTRTTHLTDKKKIIKESKGGISVKGKTSKISLFSHIDISKSKLGSVRGRCENEVSNHDVKRKRGAVKSSNKLKKQKTTGTTKSLQKQDEKSPEGYFHGILKSPERFTSADNANASNNLENRDVTSLRHVRQSDKRVSFSGNDSILGPQSKNCSSVEFLHLRNLSKGFSKSLAPSSDAYAANSTQPPDADEVRLNVEDELHIGSASVHDKENLCSPDDRELGGVERHLDINITEPINHENCSEMKKTAPCHSVDLNRSLTSYGDLDMLVPCTSPAPSNPMNSGCSTEISKQFPMVNVVEGISSSKHNASGRPPLHSGYICGSTAVSSISYLTKARSQESSHHLTMANEHDDGQSFNLLDSSSNILNHSSDVQPFYNVPRSKPWNNNHYSSLVPERPFSEKDQESGGPFVRSDAAEIYQRRYINGNFIGLPLNSQGELIQLQSQGNFGITDLSEARSIGLSSGCSAQKRIHAIQKQDHQNKDRYLNTRICAKERDFFTKRPLFQDQPTYRHSMAANIFPELPVLDMCSQYQESGRGIDHHAYRFLLEHRPSSFHGFRGYNEDKRHDEIEIASINNARDVASQPFNQPTMRLMGKNLTVGKSSQECQGFEDGKIWTDKEIIAEQNTVLQVPDISALKWHPRQENFLTFGRPDGNLAHPMESYMYHHSDSGYCHEGDIHRGIQHSHLDCVPKSGPLIVGKHLSRRDPFYPPENGQLLSCMQKQPETAGNQSVRMFSQLPMASSGRYDDRCNMLYDSAYDEYKKRPSSSLHSTVSPAFWNMENGNRIRHEFPAQNLQQWLMDTTKYPKVQNIATYPGPFSDYHPQAIFDVNFHPYSSPYPRSAMPFPPIVQGSFNRSPPDLPVTSSFGNPFTRHFPMVKSNLMAGSDCQESWAHRDGLSSRIVYLDEHDQTKMVKKRPPAKPDDMMKSAKKPNLVILDDIDIPEGSKKTDSPRGPTKYTFATPDFCATGDKEIAPEIYEKIVHPDASKSSSSKLGSGSGPIKLSAGAKHILKPCENMDLDKSRPIHSTIPFPTRSETWKAPAPQKKAAKVYQF